MFKAPWTHFFKSFFWQIWILYHCDWGNGKRTTCPLELLVQLIVIYIVYFQNNYPEYNNNVNKALDYITRELDGSNNLHAMAIATYVLSKANHNAKVAFLQRLDAMAVTEGNSTKTF